MKRATIFSALLLTACAQMQPQILVTGDENQAYTVRCSNSAYSVGSCYDQAGKICGSGGFSPIRSRASEDNVLSLTFSCRAAP